MTTKKETRDVWVEAHRDLAFANHLFEVAQRGCDDITLHQVRLRRQESIGNVIAMGERLMAQHQLQWRAQKLEVIMACGGMSIDSLRKAAEMIRQMERPRELANPSDAAGRPTLLSRVRRVLHLAATH